MDEGRILRIDQIRCLVLEIEKWTKREDLERWRVRTTGPYWSALRRFTQLLDAVHDLLLLVDELRGTKNE